MSKSINTTNQRERRQIPISLGKPSLRRRLEAYYMIVAPDQLKDDKEGGKSSWLTRFEQIWDKYGGTDQGEAKLSAKLAKKYGSTVRLLTAAAAPSDTTKSHASEMVARWNGSRHHSAVKTDQQRVVEVSFLLTNQQRNSGVIDFLSDRFDPNAALEASFDHIKNVNPWMTSEASMMERVDQCRCLLPQSDPLYQPGRSRSPTATTKPVKTKTKPPPFFAQIATPLENGPFSLLHHAMTDKCRIRVLVRYVNGIRGTVTGFVMAFDKHFNLLLRDADEMYSPRCVNDNGMSNAEVELQRRMHRVGETLDNHLLEHTESSSWTVRRRRLRQTLIRGDNVVLVYKAEEERSAWPHTAKSPQTIYRRMTSKSNVPSSEQIGTPGSLIYATFKQSRRYNREMPRQLDYTSSR